MRNFEHPGRSASYGRDGMAATSSPLATLAAVDVLRSGGNAADAAITASAVLCVTEPHMTGIGGDCFALVGLADGTVHGLNGSGRSARAADADWLKRSDLSSIEPYSVHAVTVPGAVHAWDTLLKRFGTIDLQEALKPAIRLAESGTPVTPRVAWDWPEMVERLAQDPGGTRHYLAGGRAPAAGDIMRYPALAQSFRDIAAGGARSFYEGRIAEDILATLRPRGSLLSAEDFAKHQSDWVDPISTRFAGHDILEIPPNGQGLTALIALNILSRFDLTRGGPCSARRYHLEIEAMKLAWSLRNDHIADGEVDVAGLLSAGTADRLAGLIREDRARDDGGGKMPGSDTVYLTVVDRNRMAVSFINSVYWSWGSGIVTEKTGIALQNRGAGFVTTPGHPNCIGPSKRPLHTIIPAMVRKDGKIAMSYGVMGGSYQPMGHVAVAVNRYVHGMDPQEALDHPRLFPENGKLLVEDGIGDGLRADLAALGHAVVAANEPLGGGQAIEIDQARGVLRGGSDPRKDGFALGF